MSYESPINLMIGEINTKIEGGVLSAVQRAGVDVDKEELIRALAYDRGQYEKGYQAGRWARDAEIIRCQRCRNKERKGRGGQIVCGITGKQHAPDWYCGDGEREEEEDG